MAKVVKILEIEKTLMEKETNLGLLLLNTRYPAPNQ